MKGFIKLVGWIIIIIGVFIGLRTGFTLEVGIGYKVEPHPYRWSYAFGIILSSMFSGLLLIGIAQIIDKLDEQIDIVFDIKNKS